MFDIFNMLKKEEHKDAKQVTRETIIGDILDMDQTTAPYFMDQSKQARPLCRRFHQCICRFRCAFRCRKLF